MRKPFFWKARQAWYLKLDNGSNLKLDEDEETAFTKWGRMVELGKYQNPDATVHAIAEAWLAEHQTAMSDLKFKDATRILKSFVGSVGTSQTARDLQPSQVRKWLSMQEWSDSRASDAVARVKRILAWSFDQGWLARNPLASFTVPKGKPREQLIEDDAHPQMIALLKGSKRWRPFIAVLIALRLTGARPINVRTVTVKHMDKACTRWAFKQHKTSGKTGKPLVVHLSPCMQTLCKILKAKRSGIMFVNYDGNAWTKNAIVHRMASLRERLDLPAQTVAYSYRHTYATDALLSGENDSVVAALMGHKDASMISKVYGHVVQHQDELADRVAKIAKKRL